MCGLLCAFVLQADTLEASHGPSHTLHSTNSSEQVVDQKLNSHSQAPSLGPNSLSAFRMLTTSNTVNATNSLSQASTYNVNTSIPANLASTTGTNNVVNTEHPPKYQIISSSPVPVTTVFNKATLMHLAPSSSPPSSSSTSAHHGRVSVSSPSVSVKLLQSQFKSSSPSSNVPYSTSTTPHKHLSDTSNPRATSAYPAPHHKLSNKQIHSQSTSNLLHSTLSFPSSPSHPSHPNHPMRLLAKHQASFSKQPSYAQRWQNRGGSLANLNERTVPAYQVRREASFVTYSILTIQMKEFSKWN